MLVLAGVGEGSVIPTDSDGAARTRVAADDKQTVLVVDDDARLRDVLCTVLAPLDCEIVQAGSGEEALTSLLQRKVAVIVLDKNMPGMDGFETAQLIRETGEFASTPIIFLTGQADEGDLHRGYDLGAVDFLLKPVSRQVLYAKVKALLELDRSFARLHREAAKLHEAQLQAALSAEKRQREELAFTRRREKLANVFAEESLDLASLEKTIVSELSQLFATDCLLRLPVADGEGWHHSFSTMESGETIAQSQTWLVEQLATRVEGLRLNNAVIAVELSARGTHVGFLCIGRPDGRAFSEVESASFRGISAAAALAISNATLYRVQAEYAAVMQATGDAIVAVDGSGGIRSCNKAATALFSGGRDTLIGRSIVDLAVPADQDRLREQLDVTLATHEEHSLEMTLASGEGRPVDVFVTLSPIGDSVGLNVAVLVHDLTEIKEAQTVISHLATHDPLTDLANRRQLTERLEDLAARRHGLAALLYVDINKFKAVNDTYGHDTGDQLLVEVASRIASEAGDDALVCRIGGDEFVILFEDVSSTSDAVAAGNRILERVQGQPVHCRTTTIYPSLSMGMSCLGASARTAEELLCQGDIAMFEAKQNRLTECVLYDDRIGARHQGTLSLRAGVSDAIARSELRMAYQSIVDSATGALVGLEALIRWRVGESEMSAGEIVALAEGAGQIGQLGQWVMARSFEDYASLGRDDLKLHVNLTPDQLLDPSFLDHLIEARRNNGIAPESICLELTERTFHGDPARARLAVRQVREHGFALAIYDFGLEHASMTNLLHVPVDSLKIDRSFISDVYEDERSQRLVRSQIAVAACMKVGVIATGVEKQTQADWLRRAGCVLQQGFLYSYPVEATDLNVHVQTWTMRATHR